MESFNKFLSRFRSEKGQGYTHTSIGQPKISLNVPDDRQEEFLAAYKRAMIGGIPLHLTEKPKNPSCMRADLDFRFSLPSDETTRFTRLYTTEHIDNIALSYFKVLHEYVDAPPECFMAYIMEKSRPSEYRHKLKDGIHIVWPYLVVSNHMQHWIRKKILDVAKEMFAGLPLLNLYDDVVDIAIIDRNAWQMYGSKKPDNEPYRVSRVLTYDVEEGTLGTQTGSLIDVTPASITAEMDLSYVDLFSMRNKSEAMPVKADKAQEIEEYIRCVLPTMDERRKTKLHQQIFGKAINHVRNYTNDEELHLARQLVIECLNQVRAENYEDWIKLGWTLRNIDYRLIDAWTEFSKLSSKYMSGECEKIWDTMRIDTLGMGTLRWWAMQDNEQRYNDILESNVITLVDKCTNENAHFDVAKVVYSMFKDEYRFTLRDTWYMFSKTKHRWVRSCEGLKLRFELSNRVCAEFIKRANYWSMQANQLPTGSEQTKEVYMRRQHDLSNISWNLKKSGYKENVMRECKCLFADEKFEEMLDSHPHLLGFENGVYDLRMHEFRGGSPDDYISFSTGRYYMPFDPACPEAKEIDNYFKQVFTNPNVCKYFKDLLAVMIDGGMKQEKFYVFTGSGSNSKSKVLELLQKAIGDYYVVMPIALITQKRAASNSAQGELERCKGRRVAVMQEPGPTETIQVGIMKELTGGDTIQCRALYKSPIEYRPQFKAVLTTNVLPEVPGDDGGTWRRIRVIDFTSKFCENPDPKKATEFPLDMQLAEKFDQWADPFISMLIDHHKKSDLVNMKDISEVMVATKQYQRANDILGQFMEERIVEVTENPAAARMQLIPLSVDFRSWAQTNLQKGKRLPDKTAIRMYFEKLWNPYPADGKGWRGYAFKDTEAASDEES